VLGWFVAVAMMPGENIVERQQRWGLSTLTVLVLVTASCGLRAQVYGTPEPASGSLPPNRIQFTRDLVSEPWFQGWYTRITDADATRSIAVVGASQFLPYAQERENDAAVPGYLAIIVSEGDETHIYEAFPERTSFWSSRNAVPLEIFSEEWTRFEWNAEGYGFISEDMIQIAIPGGAQVHATLGQRLPWNYFVPWLGPEGLVEFLSFVPLHWLVYSLGSDSYYTFEPLDGTGSIASGFGIAHQESNWGEVFPPAWVWAQAVGLDNMRQLALAGGELVVGDQAITTWLLAFHSPTIAWEFRPTIPGSVFATTIDSCAGSFRLLASDTVRKLEIIAEAPPLSFVEVSVPTSEGYLPGGSESFSTTIEVNAFLRLGANDDLLIDTFEFEGGALEFGGRYRCDAATSRQ
jgi:hypothetical protein